LFETWRSFIAVAFQLRFRAYAIRTVQVKQDAMTLIRTYQLLVYVDDVNILCGSVRTIKESVDTLIVAIMETGLELNADTIK